MHPSVNEIAKVMKNTNLPNYWPGFEPVAYALYNKENVYLFNHPKFPSQKDGYVTLPWTEQFIADTLILFEETPTAIVNIDRYEEFADLYAILIHELFHGYQYIKDEKRFPDEMKGITYPLSPENVELRNAERASLYAALLATDLKEKTEHLQQFIALREQRALLIGDYLHYEYHIETIEGPAWYVEVKAYADKSTLAYDEIVQKYGKSLLEIKESTLHLRRSCYSTGLFMCLLLDELSPNWQDSFMESSLTLYPFFRQCINIEQISLDALLISNETLEVIQYINECKENEFEQFKLAKGYHLSIHGPMTFKMIDPMNIVFSEQRLLHTNYIALLINGQENLFQQPVITQFKETIRSIHTIQLFYLKSQLYRITY
ncbi:hypothetical protein [Sporosarcina sp. OR05]|uniref:hypothetical protein n=1 Tax=Sporosarcina sp. OR05 TaxID=2969819 RepID=UPI00352BBBA0